jgi:hypothetical protein
VYIHEDVAMLVLKERLEDAMRFAEQRRALRAARRPPPPARVRLGMALVRFGHRIMGESMPGPGSPEGKLTQQATELRGAT